MKVYALLDAGFFCHVGFQIANSPIVIPTVYIRRGQILFLHGSYVSLAMLDGGNEFPVSVAVTLIDRKGNGRPVPDLRLWRFQSVILFGRARKLDRPQAGCDLRNPFAEAFDMGPAELHHAVGKYETSQPIVYAVDIVEAFAKVRCDDPAGSASPLEPMLDISEVGGLVPCC